MKLEQHSKEMLVDMLRLTVKDLFILDYTGNILEGFVGSYDNQDMAPCILLEKNHEHFQLYIERLHRTKKRQDFEYRCMNGGVEHFYKVTLNLLGEDKVLLTITDVTEKNRWGERLMEKERALEETLKISENRWSWAVEVNKRLLQQKKSLECLFNNSPDAIVRFDSKHEVVSINKQFTDLFGYSIDEIKGKNINRVIDPHNQVMRYGSYEILVGETIQYYDTVRYSKEGQPISVILRGAPIIINNEIIGGFAIYTDIRQRKKDQEQIIHQKKILESFFNYSPDAIGHLDKKGNIIDINKRFTEIFGYTLEECKGKNLDLLIADEDLIEEALLVSKKALLGESVELETVRTAKGGKKIPVSIRGGATVVNGEIIGLHGFYTDITERKATEAHIRYLSYHDKLTGLFNRAYFEDSLTRLDTEEHLPISIIIGDVNGLKLTNDTFGHLEGDRLLIKIAEIIKNSCRKEDVVARWGGDEFAVILHNTPEERAKSICQEIKRRCEEAEEDPIKISISLGYGTKISVEEEINEIIKKAEEQMYKNKIIESKNLRSQMFASLRENLKNGDA
ncbi:sensor domain-containing diguanylate cyclase [Alkaliphilus hydrothermalis]|uniref:Diguanylate cyclase (GGDEF)-like protein/PAS domain S-box-containing protein n=1 Tax=Alkaliphilus hydrothermalis TaxID=1482730 RepID=A0ABS2NTT6_9FIRM|nr:sensor domain-containing diguanylate cyclase [Alkaliphilus hydrothermalis]MBM7616360.1 diguanylate cyclase (GGDEF)-like protein/PAS domain S-box-containing protein [Alkaliphilus hydrothermalis]